jgi:hypothetical protein
VIDPSDSAATSPAYTVTTDPGSVSLAVFATATSWAPALLAIPVADSVTVSFTAAVIHVLTSCSVADLRVLVYVQVTSLSGIVNVAPGKGPDGVTPVQDTVVV